MPIHPAAELQELAGKAGFNLHHIPLPTAMEYHKVQSEQDSAPWRDDDFGKVNEVTQCDHIGDDAEGDEGYEQDKFHTYGFEIQAKGDLSVGRVLLGITRKPGPNSKSAKKGASKAALDKWKNFIEPLEGDTKPMIVLAIKEACRLM